MSKKTGFKFHAFFQEWTMSLRRNVCLYFCLLIYPILLFKNKAVFLGSLSELDELSLPWSAGALIKL